MIFLGFFDQPLQGINCVKKKSFHQKYGDNQKSNRRHSIYSNLGNKKIIIFMGITTKRLYTSSEGINNTLNVL